jgi:diamine N-acetyltransferase
VRSLAEALIPPVENGAVEIPWYRAVAADGEIVGFVMVARSQPAPLPDPYLWRLLVDRMHQRRGIGGRVLDMVVEQCRQWGDTALLVSWVPGPGSPEPMYLASGFVPTGVVEDGEIEARLDLQ